MQNTVNALMELVHEKYGEFPEVCYDGSIWTTKLHNWHQHRTASYGTLCGHGRTLGRSLEKLLNLETLDSSVFVSKGNNCTESCPRFEDDIY